MKYSLLSFAAFLLNGYAFLEFGQVGLALSIPISALIFLLYSLAGKVELNKKLMCGENGFIDQHVSDELIPWDKFESLSFKSYPTGQGSRADYIALEMKDGASFGEAFSLYARQGWFSKALLGERTALIGISCYKESPHEIYEAFAEAFNRRRGLTTRSRPTPSARP